MFVFSISTIYATTSADIEREKWENDYVDFNPETIVTKSMQGRNPIPYRAIGGGAKKTLASIQMAIKILSISIQVKRLRFPIKIISTIYMSKHLVSEKL